MLPLAIYMKQVAKPFSAGLFLGLATFFLYVDVFPIGSIGFAWLGGIQLFNSIAPHTPFSRAIHWIHAMTFEVPALLGVAAMRFIPTKEIIQGKGRPILLIHGYMNHSSVWRVSKKRLETVGLGPIYTINLGHPFQSIRQYAEKVKGKVENIANETGRKDLILIGHSMGGLVGSWYASKLASRGTVTDVITIGTPLFGTWIAHIGLGPNAREMQPNSQFLKELHTALRDSKEIRFHHLATKSDYLVVPGNSAFMPQNNHFIFEDLGHASLLYSRRVTDKIAQWLEPGAFPLEPV